MKGIVTASALNVRNAAGTNSSVIGSIARGTKVNIDKSKSKQGWYFIEYGSNGGYVSSDYINIIAESEKVIVEGKVTATSLNVRSAAGTNSTVIGSIARGTKVNIDKNKSKQGWYFIEYGPNGGYVSADYIEIINDNNSGNSNKDEYVTGTVTATSLNVRSAAGTNSSIIGNVKQGEKVKINKNKSVEGWYFINYGSNSGYVSSKYINVINDSNTNNNTAEFITGTVTATSLNIRSGAGTNSSIIGSLNKGDKVKINKNKSVDGWYYIEYKNGGGFISKDYVEIGNSNPGSGANNTKGEQILDYAKRFLGTPYVWGGETPKGFDCSGFVKYVYNHFGINLPRTAAQQINCGRVVSINELQVGDLVFGYRGPNGPGHVGIYAGNNKYIHAPQTGDVVKIASLYNCYTGRRLI